jgi:ligand-binding SRPBCC domain-containing protein
MGGVGILALSPAPPAFQQPGESGTMDRASEMQCRMDRPRLPRLLSPKAWHAAPADAPVTVTATTRFDANPARVFAFHADARNLPRLLPGPVRLLQASTPSRPGDLQIVRLGVPPCSLEWHARIEEVVPPERLTDVQERGPFRTWRHTHLVEPAAGGAALRDTVQFRLLPGRLGRLLDGMVVATALWLLFAERHRRTRRILGRRRAGR